MTSSFNPLFPPLNLIYFFIANHISYNILMKSTLPLKYILNTLLYNILTLTIDMELKKIKDNSL